MIFFRCIWVVIPGDRDILYWSACGADGWSVGRSVGRSGGVRSRNYQIF